MVQYKEPELKIGEISLEKCLGSGWMIFMMGPKGGKRNIQFVEDDDPQIRSR